MRREHNHKQEQRKMKRTLPARRKKKIQSKTIIHLTSNFSMRSTLFRRSAAILSLSVVGSLVAPAIISFASSHREAPMISQDPAADATDLYAFVDPNNQEKIVFIVNSNPLGLPGAGPNYMNFATDVVYAVHIDNNGDAKEDFTYAFTFERRVANGNTFLYNTKPYDVLADGNVTYKANAYLIKGKFLGMKTQLRNPIATFDVAPPAIGPKSQPDYEKLATQAIAKVGDASFFAGPRDDSFFVDLRVFDLLDLKRGTDSLAGTNVQTIAFEVPSAWLTADGKMASKSSDPVIGVWSANYRSSIRVLKNDGSAAYANKLIQVSRLGMPLVNEVVVPLTYKDYFNASKPEKDADTQPYADVVLMPELAGLFKAVLGLDVPLENRTDLVTVFLTGVPGLNQPRSVRAAEMLRLNMATVPTPSEKVSRLGVFGGDTAGFPNGRRLGDDVTDIAIQAVAGTLVDKKYANDKLGDGVNANDKAFLPTFPFAASPNLLAK